MCIKALLKLISGGGKPNNKPPVIVPDTNKWPIAYPPFTPAMDFGKGSRITYDLRYRVHGCDASGYPTSATGARDPDGDTLEYRIMCKWSVFDAGRNKVNNLWLEFPKDDRGEQLAIVALFIGWERDVPPYPFAIMSHKIEQHTEGCVSNVGPEPFTYEVRDHKGGMASHTVMLGR